MCCVCVSVTKGHSGDGCHLASTFSKGDLYVLAWARVRRVRWRSNLSHLIKCDLLNH